MASPSEKYRLMIYCAHSTIVFYQKDIVAHDKTTVEEFMENNRPLVERVVAEVISIFGYELSFQQVERACAAYLQSKFSPLSVKETEVYKLKNL